MQAGRLDRRVTLRQITETTPFGAVVREALDVATVWAQKVPDRGMEQGDQSEVAAWSVVTWKIRWFQIGLDSPNARWQVVEGARVYDVTEVREIGRREGWEIVARYRAEDAA